MGVKLISYAEGNIV